MIKHNSASSVFSPFNPVIALDPLVRREVNHRFIQPIIESFFRDKGGTKNFDALDMDSLTTEVEFLNKDSDESFIKSYIYKQIITEISKDDTGKVHFNPKYVITFDEDLTAFEPDNNVYPFKTIFQNAEYEENNIWYGVIRLGDATILYYIYIDIQELIRFIKSIKVEQRIFPKVQPKINASPKAIRNELINQLIAKKQNEIFKNNSENEKTRLSQEIERLNRLRGDELKGVSGKLRINLAWNSTDDLDLQIQSDNGKINYSNNVLEENGVIGKLDVDANAGANNLISNPQENINYDGIPDGKHIVSVNFYAKNENDRVPFTLFIGNGLDSRIYESYVINTGSKKMRDVLEFELRNGELVFTPYDLS